MGYSEIVKIKSRQDIKELKKILKKGDISKTEFETEKKRLQKILRGKI